MTFVLKLESSGDIRRSVCSAAFTLGDLVSLAQSAWGIQVPSFSYTDSDGDNISIVNSSDWRAAVDFGVSQSLLRVKVSRDGRAVVLDDQQAPTSVSSVSTAAAVVELDTASRAAQLYEQGNSTEGIELLEKALESDSNNVVLLLLIRLFYRTWPESLCSRIHQVDPCSQLLARAKNASATDHTSAEQYLRGKATSQPSSTWSYLLGLFYDGVIDAADAAVAHFREAIERGGRASGVSRSALGLLFETGRGVYMSTTQAKQYYADGARLGDPSSMCNYARLLEGDERREWLERAANTRLGVAMFNFAIEEGVADSLQWLEAAAKLGVDIAQFELGVRRRNGSGGCEKDDIEAVSWLASAAEQGHREAKYYLGTVYLEGAGDVIEKNGAEALRLLTEAAEAGSTAAQYMLGSLYEASEGEIVAQDSTRAFEWYLRAATGSHRGAQLEVGSMYAEGRGVVASEAEAQKWFLLATGESAPAAEDLASTRAEVHQQQQQQQPSSFTAAPSDITGGLLSSTGSLTPVLETQESIKQRLLDGGFVGSYYTWTSIDGGASWEPSARVILDAEGTLVIGDEVQSGQQFGSNLANPAAIDVNWGQPSVAGGVYGEVTFVAGAVESDAIWGEDLSNDSKLFSGWIEPYGQVRAAIRGIREDPSSVEFRWFVPEASSLDQSIVSPVVSSAQLQTLRANILSLESFMIRSAVQWNASTGERQQWARAVKHAELGSHLGACLLQLMTNINEAYAPNIGTVVEQYRTIFAPNANNVLVRQVAEALLAIEINLPWSAVVPIFRTYRSEWVGALRNIVDEPNAEVQQTLHTSILTGGARNRDINSAVVAFPQHSPMYSLPSGLAVLDSVRIRAQVQSTLNENLHFNVNFNGNTPATHEFQLSFKRSAGDTGIVTFNYGYGHNSEVVAAEGHPFPAVAEDFDILITINADKSISITIEPLGISHTSAPLDFISIPEINRVQLEAPHGRVLVRTFIHSYTRSSVIQPGANTTGDNNWH